MKIHRFLFYLLILFLPIQLGKHFWPDWTMVYGLRLDYLSPTFYFTDIIIIGILVSWGVEKITNSVILRHQPKNLVGFFTSFRMTKKQVFLFLGFFVFLLANCFSAQNHPAAFYKLAKILEFSFLGFYVAKNITIDKLFNYSIATAIIYSSLLAIGQFIKQGSLGGIFYWFGERTFASGTPGIAQAVWNGELLLRPYATFPHPNVLAGFLVIGLLLILVKNRQMNTVVVICPLVLGTIALFLTFSHVAWVVFGLMLLVKILLSCHSRVMPEADPPLAEKRESRPTRKTWIPDQVGDDKKILNNKKKIFLFSVFLLSIFYFLFSAFPIQPESITYRQDLNLAAIKMWQSSPLTGVGLNNFLVRLPEFYESHGEIRWFQPTHNFFLMVLAETGAIGLTGVIGFLFLTYKRLLDCSIVKLLIPLTAILVLCLFDHYFYTLQQGQILLTIILGLCWAVPSCGKM